MRSIAARLKSLDWEEIAASLRERGYAITPPVLDAEECASLRSLYPRDRLFRATIDMARHRFGEGEYRYFRYPLPPIVRRLRASAYLPLARIATSWAAAGRGFREYPESLADFLDLCREKRQTRPTPLLLRYGAGGYNCLHRDLYGEVAFPLQMTVFLNRPHADYRGGAFLLVEQRPRQQSVGEALFPPRGACVVFATAERPVAGARGYFRGTMRHGVARITRGERYTLGVIFHDAK